MRTRTWMKKSVGAEAIAFQAPEKLFEPMVEAINKIKMMGVVDQSLNESGLGELIHDHTGINVRLRLYGDERTPIGGLALTPILDGNHIFNKAVSAASQCASLEAFERYLGKTNLTVFLDRKDGKITGDASLIPIDVLLPVSLFKNIPAEEAASVILHEVGHEWTSLERIMDTCVANFAISTAADEMMKLTSKKERLTLIAGTLDKIRLKELPDDDIVESNDKEVIVTHLIMHYIKERRTAEGNRYYSRRACEFAADQFAIRYGAGKYLVKALYRMNMGRELDARYNNMFRRMNDLVVRASKGLFVGTLVATGALLAWPMTIALSPFILWQMVFFYDAEPTYDKPAERWARVINEIKAELKDKNLGSDRRKQVLEDLQWLEEVLRGQNKTRRPLVKAAINYMFTQRRKDRNHEKFQQELESLVHNDLFVASAQFASNKE